MKTIIAGSRDFLDQELVNLTLLDCPWTITEIVCGEARGADTLGKNWGKANHRKVISFPADWDKHGRSAGFLRNKEMAAYADACIVFIKKGGSPGSENMIKEALKAELRLLVIWV